MYLLFSLPKSISRGRIKAWSQKDSWSLEDVGNWHPEPSSHLPCLEWSRSFLVPGHGVPFMYNRHEIWAISISQLWFSERRRVFFSALSSQNERRLCKGWSPAKWGISRNESEAVGNYQAAGLPWGVPRSHRSVSLWYNAFPFNTGTQKNVSPRSTIHLQMSHPPPCSQCPTLPKWVISSATQWWDVKTQIDFSMHLFLLQGIQFFIESVSESDG